VSAPDVAIPAARLRVPGATPFVAHSPGCERTSSTTPTMNIVVPYMSIVSPGARTPTLAASAHASIVPAATGVPSARPVSDAAAAVTVPAISAGHRSRGSSNPGAIPDAHSSIHAPAPKS
jgi:hypothetical protein